MDSDDQDFDPSVEMLVNDFDDEHTLAEEEALESADSVTNELDDLQREGEMPLDEVLAMYGYESGIEYEDTLQDLPNHESDSSLPESPGRTNESHGSPHSFLNRSIHSSASDSSPSDKCTPSDRKLDEVIDLAFRETSPIPLSSSRPLLRSVHQASESSDTGTDYDYSPDEDWRKTIQVGSDFQATIPEGLQMYDDAPAYENEDRLIWDPSVLSDEEVEEYLRACRQAKSANAMIALPNGSHVRDDEQALLLLLQCGHNIEEALRRRRMQSTSEAMTLWSEEECRSFELGIKSYGKDFHMIQQNKVRTRSVSELVQFYYLWKKTERHDVFASKNRIEKKKYALHPGTTDFMDRFLDEQENLLNARERSSSPTSNLPIDCYEEMKKLTPLTSPDTNADRSTPEMSVHGFDILDGPSSTGTYSNGATSMEHTNSPNKNRSRIPSDCSGDYVNGEEKVSGTSMMCKDDNSLCLNLEALAVVNENVSNQSESDRNLNVHPPNDVITCSHILNDIARCGFRFDYGKDSVSVD